MHLSPSKGLAAPDALLKRPHYLGFNPRSLSIDAKTFPTRHYPSRGPDNGSEASDSETGIEPAPRDLPSRTAPRGPGAHEIRAARAHRFADEATSELGSCVAAGTLGSHPTSAQLKVGLRTSFARGGRLRKSQGGVAHRNRTGLPAGLGLGRHQTTSATEWSVRESNPPSCPVGPDLGCLPDTYHPESLPINVADRGQTYVQPDSNRKGYRTVSLARRRARPSCVPMSAP